MDGGWKSGGGSFEYHGGMESNTTDASLVSLDSVVRSDCVKVNALSMLESFRVVECTSLYVCKKWVSQNEKERQLRCYF